MRPKLLVSDKPIDMQNLITYLKDYEYISFDTETTGLHKGAQIVGISVCADEDQAFYLITTDLDPTPLLLALKEKKLIGHNVIFDCAKIEENYKIRLIESVHTDTMILAHLLNETRRVGLKELAKEMFGDDSTIEAEEMKASVIANGGEWSAKNKDMYKADPQILGKYGAKDAWLTYKLFLTLVPELYEQGLDKFFYEEESMPLLHGPTYDLNTTGLKVDVEALNTLKRTLMAECAEAKDFIYSEIISKIKDKYPGTNKKNTFNIGSSQQLSWLLFGQYGLEFGKLTDAGRDICQHLNMRLPYTFKAKRDFIAICMGAKDSIHALEGTINGKKVRAKRLKTRGLT